jgi:glycosyltransferase involved in cell wall biosynthesis
MKILHVISGDTWGGAESQALELISKLKNFNNIRIKLLCFNYCNLVEYAKLNNIEVQVISENDNNIFLFFRKIYKYIINDLPQIIHTHGYKENFFVGFICLFINNIKVVRTFHGKGMLNASIKHIFIEYVNAFIFSNHLISVSNDLKNYIKEKLKINIKISVVHNFIDFSENLKSKSTISLKKKIGILNNNLILGTAGRLVPVKNHKFLLLCMKRIFDNGYRINAVICGDGPLRDDLLAFSKSIGINCHVKFVGYIDNINDYFEIFDIFILPSLHEGVPMVLLEAMRMKKPIIASNIGGIPEVITHNFDGYLADPKDVNQFSKYCIDLINDTKKAFQFGNNAYNTGLSHFDSAIGVRKTIEVYRKVLV